MIVDRKLGFAICSIILFSAPAWSRAEELPEKPALEAPVENTDNRTALERFFGGYVERAQHEGKDLLIVLYNSTRLPQEKKDALLSPAWREKILSRAIPIEIDVREEITKDADAVVPVEALLQQFQVKGGPAFMALDTKGHSFGQVAYKKQSADEFIKEVEALFTVKKQRDELLAKADDLEVQQVKLLDQLVEGLLKSEADLSNYRGLLDRVIDLDDDDKAGVKAKYRALAGLYDAEHLLLTGQFDEGMKLMRNVDGSLLPESLKRNRDQRLIRMNFLTNRPGDAEKYVKEVIANKNVAVAYKQELTAFLAARFKTDKAKSTTWYKLALSLDKDGPGAAEIAAKLKAEETSAADAPSSTAHSFKTADGTFDPASLKGKSVGVMLFWTGSYKASLATLAELSAEYKGTDVNVYAVNVGDNELVMNAYAAKSNLSLNWAFDPERVGADQFGVQHFPTVILIGKDGTVKNTFPGLSMLNKDDVKKGIEALRK